MKNENRGLIILVIVLGVIMVLLAAALVFVLVAKKGEDSTAFIKSNITAEETRVIEFPLYT